MKKLRINYKGKIYIATTLDTSPISDTTIVEIRGHEFFGANPPKEPMQIMLGEATVFASKF